MRVVHYISVEHCRLSRSENNRAPESFTVVGTASNDSVVATDKPRRLRVESHAS